MLLLLLDYLYSFIVLYHYEGPWCVDFVVNEESHIFCSFLQVLDAMSSFGLGVDDASHAFTVSRAVRRAMKERGLSAVEAIDDLSSKLNISNLVTSSPSEELVDDDQTLVSTSRPSSPAQQQRTAPAPTPATADRISTQQQHRKRKASAKTNHKNTKQKKTLSRKRPAPSSNDEKKFSSSRERADSVTEAVEAKAKKARRSSPEDSPSPEAPSDASIIVRSKRNASNLTRDEQPQSSTP
jgi:hypothetical protein